MHPLRAARATTWSRHHDAGLAETSERAKIERVELGGADPRPRLRCYKQVRRKQAVRVVHRHRRHTEKRGEPRQSSARSEEAPRPGNERQLYSEVGAWRHERSGAPDVGQIVEVEITVLVDADVGVEHDDGSGRRGTRGEIAHRPSRTLTRA